MCMRVRLIRGLLIRSGVQSLKSENRDSYNERNFENLVNHYEKELRRILRGGSVSKILSKSERARLLRSGVLIRKGRGTYVQWMVSKKALDILFKKKWKTRVRINAHLKRDNIMSQRCIIICVREPRFPDALLKNKNDRHLRRRFSWNAKNSILKIIMKLRNIS